MCNKNKIVIQLEIKVRQEQASMTGREMSSPQLPSQRELSQNEPQPSWVLYSSPGSFPFPYGSLVDTPHPALCSQQTQSSPSQGVCFCFSSAHVLLAPLREGRLEQLSLDHAKLCRFDPCVVTYTRKWIYPVRKRFGRCTLSWFSWTL